MRIAQVSPLYESVPPRWYGGTERVVSYLTEELVALGHEVTLFASGDSVTEAELVPPVPRALRLDGCPDPIAPHLLMFTQLMRRLDDFDLIHFHTDYLHLPLTEALRGPHLTTMHGALDVPHLLPLYREYSCVPLASISMSQRRPLPGANWVGTVHHGLPAGLLRAGGGEGGYLAFLGRISPEKRVDRAIDIATRAGIPLRIAAKISDVDRPYFEREIAPLLDHPLVEFIGEIDEAEKGAFLGRARALLFPIDWEEPFGLVMAESLACGTPVIAFRSGSVPEVIEDGVTGYLVTSVDEAVEAVHRIDRISRARCRRAFDTRFTARRMAEDYLALYARLVTAGREALPSTDGAAAGR